MNNKKRWLILMCVGLITFMNTLDSSIVNVALPVINKDLHITMSLSELVVSVYLIGICALLIPFGKLGDHYGKVKIFKIGMIIFTLGSLTAALSNNLTFLLVSRLIQALGASMTMSNNNGIITEVFPANERGQALGWIGSFVALGMIAGPGIGGLLLAQFHWSSIFWVNVPIGIVIIIISHFILPASATNPDAQSNWLDMSLFALGIIGLFGFMYAGQNLGYASSLPLGLIIIAIIAFTLFVVFERKASTKMIDYHLFKNAHFSFGLFSAFIVFITNNFYMVLMPFYLEDIRTVPIAVTGLMMTILPIIQVIVAPVSGHLADVKGIGKVTMTGLIVLVATQLGLFILNINSPLIECLLFIGMMGIGNGVFQSPNNAMIMSSAPKTELGVAGSVNALSRNFGMVTGNAAATSLLFMFMSFKVGKNISNITNDHALFIFGQHNVYLIGLILLVIVLIIDIQMERKNKEIKNDKN
ncbi:MFS transporter [Fructilactobacillus sp. Tb1]|uniref:MFS transporter n=1 Tax=Fructilactobacillus sp. Tb1 TaxID=3422304 RepID=UPI003D268538